jgi:hypothetical protein
MKGPVGARVATATRCDRGERTATERKSRGTLVAPARIGPVVDQ